MTKSDLRTGDIVTFRDGTKMQLYRNARTSLSRNKDILTNGKTWTTLNDYNEDMTCINENGGDIMMVECATISTDLHDWGCTKVLWKRQEKKKMTVAEIEAILGYGIEVVSDN